jgi:penicillin-binding protein 1A
MEKVYHDASTGYTYGPFPKAKVEITRKYNCPTPVPVVDTTTVDSLEVDSTLIDMPVIDDPSLKPVPVIQKKEEKKLPENQPAKQNTAVIVPLTKKEERELKRKQRQEEKERNKNGGN